MTDSPTVSESRTEAPVGSADGLQHCATCRCFGPTVSEPRTPDDWHRYLHQEGILVEDEGEECGPWHRRVFEDEAEAAHPIDVERPHELLHATDCWCDPLRFRASDTDHD